jgi:hypothetical protein
MNPFTELDVEHQTLNNDGGMLLVLLLRQGGETEPVTVQFLWRVSETEGL